jgi:outer membrane protein, multidrug efflux system
MRRLVVLLPLALAACAVGPHYTRPEVDAPQAFDRLDSSRYGTDAPIAQFWHQFQDPLLDQLVDDALAANHDLRIVAARMESARALARQARHDLYPTVTVSGGYTDSRTSVSQLFTGSNEPFDNQLYDVGFDAFWELDLFGRVRRANEARRAEFEASTQELAGAQVSVVAEVARTYFELRGLQAQLDVAHRNSENQRDTLNLTRARLDAGSGTEFDTSRADAQLHLTLARIPALQTAIASDIHRIGVLTGRQPETLRAQLEPAQSMPALPALTEVGSPVDLLRRRPDINAAERRLAGATARVGVAVADLFPRVTLGRNFGWVAHDASDLGDSDHESWALGPAISWPAFDLGRVRAGVKAADADTQAALAGYEQTVLRALEETETSLVRYTNQEHEVTELAASAAASENAARLAHLRFEGGVADFLQVLDSERTQLEAQDRLAASRTATATALIAVYKALGSPFPASEQLLTQAAKGH